MNDPEPVAELLDAYAAKADLPKFAEMSAGFFTLKAMGKTQLRQRPPVALRLPHGDHIFTVRPGWNAPRVSVSPLAGAGRVFEYGTFDYSRVYIDCVDTVRGRACKLVLAGGRLQRSGTWYSETAPDGVEAFVEMVNYFVLFPHQVFAKSKDRCCICGRRLKDELSRNRGIGPECVKEVHLYFGMGRQPTWV